MEPEQPRNRQGEEAQREASVDGSADHEEKLRGFLAKFRELNASLCDLSERFRDIDGEKGKRLREIVSRVQVAVSSGFYLLKIRFDAAGLAWEEGALPAIPQAEQARLYTEASTLDEMRRLQEMPPITRDSLHECDLDELLKELGDL